MHIIWNDHASQASQHQDLFEELKSRPGTQIHRSTSLREAITAARSSAESGAEVVVAAGGDGTINGVLQGLIQAQSDCALGIIPLGTGNDFCRNAGIPLDPTAAFALIESTSPRKVDIVQGEIENEIFYYLNMLTAGNTGLYNDCITEEMKSFWGPFVYLRGAVEILSQLQPFQVTLQINQEHEIKVDALNLFLANGRVTGGGLPVAPDAKLDDGLLDLVVIRDCSPVEIAQLIKQYTLNNYFENEHIIYKRVSSVSIDATPQMPISTDGDVRGGAPATFTVLKSALAVFTA